MTQFKKRKEDDASDFARLARMFTGRAIGVVLGGGGARYVNFSTIREFYLCMWFKFLVAQLTWAFFKL